MSGRHALIIGISSYPKLDKELQLKGSAADARLLAEILQKHFDFPPEAIQLLCDEQATRNGIEEAMKELIRRVGTDDSVVIAYSGHGSIVQYGEGDGPDSWDECLVPSDSGRPPNHKVLDIRDDQVHDWLLELSRKTPYVCLVLDSCFATGAIRDAGFAAPVRRLPPVRLPGRAEPKKPQGSTLRSGNAQADRWIPPNERCTLIAACRSDEGAYEDETQPGVFHGALMYQLCRELQAAVPGTTYLDVFERIAPQITASFPSQHPQLHGARHRELFGVREIRPMRFISVQKREGDSVVLDGGAVHGIEEDSLWGIYRSGTRSANDNNRFLGTVRVTQVDSLKAGARIEKEKDVKDDEGQPVRIGPGARAVEASGQSWQMSVEVAPLQDRVQEMWLKAGIGRGRKLRLAKPGEKGDVRVYILAPRLAAGPGDPVPQLGTLVEPSWVVVARDGSLKMPPIPVAAQESMERLVGNLEIWAHYCHVLQIQNRNPNDVVREQVKAILHRERPFGGWEPAVADAAANAVVYEEGEPVAVEIRNHSDQPLYIYVLDMGLAGKVELLYPFPGVDKPLQPKGVLTIGMSDSERMPLSIPKGFPFDGCVNGKIEGTEHLKVLAVPDPTDFGALVQSGYRVYTPWAVETLPFLLRGKTV